MALHTIATVVLYLTAAYAGLITGIYMYIAWQTPSTYFPWKRHLLIFLALCFLLGLQQGWITY